MVSIAKPDVFSLIQNHCIARRSENMALYEPRKNVYFQLKKYLSNPFYYCTAYERICGDAPSYCPLSREDVERMEFDIAYYFSDSVRERFEEISAILEGLRDVDRDLNELFDALEYGDVERYIQIRDAVLGGGSTEESEKILDELEIFFYTRSHGKTGRDTIIGSLKGNIQISKTSMLLLRQLYLMK